MALSRWSANMLPSAARRVAMVGVGRCPLRLVPATMVGAQRRGLASEIPVKEKTGRLATVYMKLIPIKNHNLKRSLRSYLCLWSATDPVRRQVYSARAWPWAHTEWSVFSMPPNLLVCRRLAILFRWRHQFWGR